MFCNKCGKEIPDKVLFCTYCGEKTDSSAKIVRSSSNSEKAGGIYIVVNSIISIIIAIVVLALACMEAETFEYYDISSKVVGCFLHWGVCILFIIQSVVFISLLRKKGSALLPVKFGTLLIIEGIVLKILEIVFGTDNISGDEIFLVLSRIFNRTYNYAVWLTIIMGILLIISGVVCRGKQE